MVSTRMSAADRRAAVLDVATPLVAQRGLEATPTLAIAEAAGISHAYLFRLFPTKQALGVALVQRCNQRIHERFQAAATRAQDAGEDVMEAMGCAYGALLAQDRDLLLLQLHAHAVSPVSPEIREAMRTSFADLYALVAGASGAPDAEIHWFFARGMLMNVTAALSLPEVDAPWARSLTALDAPPPSATGPRDRPTRIQRQP